MSQEPGQTDAGLDQYLQSADEVASEKILGELIMNTVEPVSRRIIQYRLGASETRRDIEDLLAETLVDALSHLRKLKSEPELERVRNLNGFAAIMAHRKCTNYFRHLRPERWRLKTRVRYILSRHTSLALWEDPNAEFVAGLSGWKGRPAEEANMEAIFDSMEVNKGAITGSLLNTILAIFRAARRPLPLDALVSACARLMGIYDKPPADPEALLTVASSRKDTLSALEQQSFLRTLWGEMQQLPERQCQALLFSIRDADGDSLLPLIPSSGVASMEEVGRILNLNQDQLLELWKQLPLEDDVMAMQWNMTRQQIINLRKSARERLARRMKRQS